MGLKDGKLKSFGEYLSGRCPLVDVKYQDNCPVAYAHVFRQVQDYA